MRLETQILSGMKLILPLHTRRVCRKVIIDTLIADNVAILNRKWWITTVVSMDCVYLSFRTQIMFTYWLVVVYKTNKCERDHIIKTNSNPSSIGEQRLLVLIRWKQQSNKNNNNTKRNHWWKQTISRISKRTVDVTSQKKLGERGHLKKCVSAINNILEIPELYKQIVGNFNVTRV